MKMKKMTAAALSLCMLAGGVMYDIPAVNDFSASAALISTYCFTFDTETGVLTLRGNVNDAVIRNLYEKKDVKKITAEEGTVLPADCSQLFGDDIRNDYINSFSSCTSIDLSNADTSNVIYASNMFAGCSSLTSLDISGFDTGNIKSMSNMFAGCTALTSLDVSGFDTSNVTNMSGMFYLCYSLASLDVSGFDTSSVKSMSYMFAGCVSLGSLDLSGFDTGSAEHLSDMFAGCSSLSDLTLGDDFREITKDHRLFSGGGWANADSPDEIISGTGDYAEFTNTGKNTYIRRPASTDLPGDISGDGFITVADIVLLQKWLLQSPGTKLPSWENADICSDGVIDVFDLIALKQLIVSTAE